MSGSKKINKQELMIELKALDEELKTLIIILKTWMNK